jgi:IclR family acetate operon transcriptional repressor
MSDRFVAVVESFLAAPIQTLSQVAAACGMELPTATRYLRQLAEHGWLERDEATRAYRLGVRLIEIGQAARVAQPLRKIVLPHMQELLARFDETVNLALQQEGEVVIIEALESRRSIRRGANVGDRDDWLVSSLGKAILAHLPPEAAESLLVVHPPVRHTKNTLTDPVAIKAELEKIRQLGYALDNEESELGLKCVGVPIPDHRGRYSHALSISGPTARIDARLDEIIAALKSVAEALAPASRGRT